jgi:hypothetical protein
MKIWHLYPQKDIEGNNPWDPWYDKAFAFVIRAETEIEARAIANHRGGDETGPIELFNHLGKISQYGGDPWLDSRYSVCEELLPEGEEGLIVRNFASA